MSRRWRQDGDDARVAPNGAIRIAYDADSQTYTYRHPNGDLYEGAAGSKHGPLRLVSQRRQKTNATTAPRGPPPVYPSEGSAPPSYQDTINMSQAQTGRRSPALTFDEILARQPTESNAAANRPREQLCSPTAGNAPRRWPSHRAWSASPAREKPVPAVEVDGQVPIYRRLLNMIHGG